MQDMRNALKLVPPRVDDERYWNLTLNHLFGCQKDALFVWIKRVRAYVEAQKNAKWRGAA